LYWIQLAQNWVQLRAFTNIEIDTRSEVFTAVKICILRRKNGLSDFVHHPDSKGPEDGNRSSFRNVVFYLLFFRIRTMDEVRKPINSVCYTPSSEPYRTYLNFGILGYDTV
jgi:hypothetical protein